VQGISGSPAPGNSRVEHGYPWAWCLPIPADS
jgi:hypothetical protein